MDEIDTMLEFVASYALYLRAALILLIGLIVSRLVKRWLRFQAARNPQLTMVSRFASGIILGISVAWALSELGMNLGYVLGAAGVLTIAIGFAAQTSVSNLISGLFLMSERPFIIGDVISVTDKTGEVIAIDLLSVKLRTFDNLLVRIPNESMLKSNVVNLSHFPIRRYDLQLGVAYTADHTHVTAVLKRVASELPIALVEPEPMVLFQRFGDSAQEFQFSVWATQENFRKLRQSLPEAVRAGLAREGIDIPFPQRVVHVTSEGQTAITPR